VVVCCEVIEHVMVSPVEMLTDLVALLRPGGVIVLTTPNFLAMSSLRVMQAGRNPGTMFNRAVGNEDAHYHVREYTMSELIEACAAAGADVQLAAYSHCWDRGDPVVMQSGRHALRKNITLVIGRAGDHPWLG
jgi:2-polyprenyl-3-methyl-5-hydroxy-6-metoxy-1,4-benzoquinol methylase